MPGTKRSSKVLSYKEEDDDDDDFIPTKKINDTKKVENKPPKVEPVEEETSMSSHDTNSVRVESDVEEQTENLSPEKQHTTEDSNEQLIDKPVIETVQSNISTNRRHSSVPLGFPTSKINIASPHVSRVGLSRKSLPAKSLHPNVISRVHPD